MPWSSDEIRIRHLEGAGVPRNSLVPEGSVFIRMFNKDEFQSHLTCSIFPIMSNNCCERMRWGINTSNGSLSAYWLIRIPWRCGHTSALLLFSCCCCSANYYSLVLSCLRNLFQGKDLFYFRALRGKGVGGDWRILDRSESFFPSFLEGGSLFCRKFFTPVLQ